MNKKEIIAFLFGGKARFTLQSKKTGKSLAFKAWRQNRNAKYFVNISTGTAGGWLGTLKRNTWGNVVYWTPRKDTILQEHMTAFGWFVNHMEDAQVEFMHCGACAVCGRRLTDADSIKRGIGPTCYAAMMETEELPF